MMRSRAAQLAARRAELVTRSEFLRVEFSKEAAAVTGRLQFLEATTAFLRSGRGRMLLFGGVTLLVLGGAGRGLKVASRIAIAWPILRLWLPRLVGPRRGRH